MTERYTLVLAVVERLARPKILFGLGMILALTGCTTPLLQPIPRDTDSRAAGSTNEAAVEPRYYYTYGEVWKRGRQEMPGGTNIDLTVAISAAGGFTEFADQRRIRISRANGKTETVNLHRILQSQAGDVTIHPGDTILVWKKGFVW